MKANKLLLLLTASALLASCGGGQQSSSQAGTTSQPETSSQASSAATTSEASGEQTSEQSQVSTDTQEESLPKDPTEEDFGVLLGEFASSFGTLNVELKTVTLEMDGGQSPTVYDVTAAGYEEYSYKSYGRTITEELPTVYFGKEDAKNRVRLGTGDYKFAVVEYFKDDQWNFFDNFMPKTSAFAGSYNMVAAGSTNPNDVLYFISQDFDYELGGYAVKSAHRSSSAFEAIPWAVHTFYTLEDEDYVLAMDFFDLTDEQYFKNPVTLSTTGLRGIDDENDYFFPDFSIMLGKIVDDQGNKFDFDYDYDGLTDYIAWDVYGEASVLHDENGFYFQFGEDENAIYARFNADELKVTFGENDIRYIAPVFTLFDDLFNSVRSFVAGDLTFTFGSDFDDDLFDYVFITKVNDESVEGTLSADANGRAYLSFTYNEKDYEIYRKTEHSINITTDDGLTLGFEAEYYDEIFLGKFKSFSLGKVTNIEFDEEHQVTVDGQTLANCVYSFDEENEMPIYGNGRFAIGELDTEQGLFAFYIDGELSSLIISEEALTSIYGDYLGKKVENSNVVIEFDENGLSYRGDLVTDLTLALLPLGNGDYAMAFSFSSNENRYLFQPDYMGAANIFQGTSSGGMAFKESILVKDQYLALSGDYIYHSQEFGEEHFVFSEDGLKITTAISETEAELVTYDVYQFAHQENGDIIIMIPYEINGQQVAIPFTFDGKHSIYSPDGSYSYLEDTYYNIQGIYYNDDHIITILGDEVIYDGLAVYNPDIVSTAFGNTVTLDEKTYLDIPKDETPTYNVLGETPVELSKYVFAEANWYKTYASTKEGDTNTYELKAHPTTGKLTAYKNGEFVMDTYTIVLVDGQPALQFKTPFITLTFCQNGTVNVIETGVLPPPPPPTLG